MKGIVLLVAAALSFAVGGLFMKASEGAERGRQTAAFLALFIAGALLQARAMRQADMGSVYIAVLGLEAVTALVLSIAVLGETWSWPRLVAVLLIVGGVALLRRF